MALEHIEKRAGRIRARREELGLTQEDVADRMQDIYREKNPEARPDRTRGQMVSDWERAENEPSPRKLELLAEALQTTVAELSVDAPDKSGPTPDPFSQNGSSTESGTVAALMTRIDELESAADSRHSELMSKLSEVSDELERLQKLERRPGRGRVAGSK